MLSTRKASLIRSAVFTLACSSGIYLPHSFAAESESIGKIIMTTSALQARASDGSIRTLQRTSPVYEGDTLVTGNVGVAQVRLRDGALLALRNNTEFKIEQFKFNQQKPEQDRGFFALLRGGFRTITGLIGKRDNTSAYRVNTPVATIGIRGTHYGLQLCQAGDCQQEGIDRDGLYGGVIDGRIVAENSSANASFGNDQYFYVASIDAAPQGLIAPPGKIFSGDMPNPDKKKEAEKVAQQSKSEKDTKTGELIKDTRMTNPDKNALTEHTVNGVIREIIQPGNNISLPVDPEITEVRAPAGTVAALAMLTSDGYSLHKRTDAIPAKGGEDPAGAAIYLRPNKSVAAVTWPADDGCSPCYFKASPTAKLEDAKINDSLHISWGRWGNDWKTNHDGPDSQVSSSWAHYIVSDRITPPSELSALTGRVEFKNLIGATRPTDITGRVGNLESINIGVDFSAQKITGYEANLVFGGGVENVAISSFSPTSFSTAAAGDMSIGGSCDGGRCGSGASLHGTASVNFVGPSAPALMTTYTVIGTGLDDVDLGYSGAAAVAQ